MPHCGKQQQHLSSVVYVEGGTQTCIDRFGRKEHTREDMATIRCPDEEVYERCRITIAAVLRGYGSRAP